MNITLLEIANQFQSKGFLLGSTADGAVAITGIAAVETAGPGDLVMMDKVEYLPYVRDRKPAAVVTSKTHKDAVAATGAAVLVVPNVGLAHALLKRKFADRDFARSGWSGVHASAVVHPTAELAAGVVVEPLVVIGAQAKIGSETRIMAGAVIENDATIGARCVIHPKSVIGYNCRLGDDVVVESGSVIGSAGFGFAQDEKRKSHPIPQTGVVVLGDRVRIGGNCCVDRATYGETRIGAGTKLDNHCHIAHNVKIGEDCLLTAMFVVAGSTTIGDRVIASGNTGVLDHVEICNDVVLLHRAGVSKDVEKPGAYAGLPLQPLGDYMKNMAAVKSANEMRKRLAAIEKKLGVDGDSSV